MNMRFSDVKNEKLNRLSPELKESQLRLDVRKFFPEGNKASYGQGKLVKLVTKIEICLTYTL